MKTEKISTTQFSSKQRFIKPKQLELIREISKKMNNESTMTSTENMFTANYVGTVRIGECVLHNDTFLHGKNGNTEYGKIGKTQIEFDKNNSILIDNETGEVTKIKKTWYTPVRRIMKKMDKYLQLFNTNFDNNEVVNKNALKIHGFTLLGLARLMSGEIAIDNENGEINV